MKTRGILMTPENYGKCDAESKLQTRRLTGLKEINTSPDSHQNPICLKSTLWQLDDGRDDRVFVTCPYGVVGDRLYVKEGLGRACNTDGVLYRRDQQIIPTARWGWQKDTLSPLHMPKWATRLWLEITDVRVERLHDISEEDAKAEGARIPEILYPDSPRDAYSYVANFRLIWESNKIHKPGSWDLNPWLWCLSFRKITV